MLDVLIRDGTVIDGSGVARRRADVGIVDGRIAAIGQIDDSARQTVDADGRVVAPGFIDIHTHYDAQVLWDARFTPSPLHGITTLVGGNCGFSIAPMVPEMADYMTTMLAKVEGMPLEALREGLQVSWDSFGGYLARVDSGLAVNAGFLAGHSALRCAVMGPAAIGERATDEQLAAMAELLRASLSAGALGFSSSWSTTHLDSNGDPVPSRHADASELVRLASVLRGHDGTVLEFIPGGFTEDRLELMTAMSLAAGTSLNWNLLMVDASQMDVVESQLAASDHARSRGADVRALMLPDASHSRYSFVSGFVLDSIPDWGELFRMSVPERSRELTSPDRRARLRAGAAQMPARQRHTVDWANYEVTASTARPDLVGRTVAEIAAEQGVDPFDALLDVVVADDLTTGLAAPIAGADDASWKLRADLWRDPRTIMGGTDAGAHLDMLSTFSCTTGLLAHGVRERGLLTLEEAIHQLTQAPAEFYGITGRGTITQGAWADLVVFDPDTVGPDRVELVHDLPAGAPRLFGGAHGIDQVVVNGQVVVEHGEFIETLPGRLLKSGRDTGTSNRA